MFKFKENKLETKYGHIVGSHWLCIQVDRTDRFPSLLKKFGYLKMRTDRLLKSMKTEDFLDCRTNKLILRQ